MTLMMMMLLKRNNYRFLLLLLLERVYNIDKATTTSHTDHSTKDHHAGTAECQQLRQLQQHCVRRFTVRRSALLGIRQHYQSSVQLWCRRLWCIIYYHQLMNR